MRLRWRYALICVVPLLAIECTRSSGHSDPSEATVLAARWSALTSGSAEATMALQSDWGSGYCANVTIANRGTTAISSWTLLLDLRQSTINQIWNGTATGSTITPVNHNGQILPGKSVDFGFCATVTGSPYLPQIASLSVVGGDSQSGSGGGTSTGGASAGGASSGGSGTGGASKGGTSSGSGGSSGGASGGKTAASGGASGGSTNTGGSTGSQVTGATIKFDSDWGSGYCATVSLTGTGAWTVVLNLNASRINNLWNGTYVASGSTATVTGNQASFGFCALSSGSNYRATITSVNGNSSGNGSGGMSAGGSGNGGTGSGGASKGGTGSGGAGKGGAANGGTGNGGTGNAGSTGTGYPPIQTGCTGYATRFWDCCKPHCGWSGNVPSGVSPMNSCSAANQTLSGYDQSSSCSGGTAHTCYGLSPYAVNTQLAYGYAATSNGDVCGRCYQLQFDGKSKNAGNDPGSAALAGKTMIVQAVNVGSDVGGGQFDLLVPGGGVGAFNACSAQWGVSNADLGVQYGGFLAACKQSLGYNAGLAAYKSCVAAKCQSVFGSRGLTDLQAGCQWFVDWFQAADNPSLKYKEVTCPSALNSKSGMNRSGRNDVSNACGN